MGDRTNRDGWRGLLSPGSLSVLLAILAVALFMLSSLLGLYLSIAVRPSVSPPPTSRIATFLAIGPGLAAVGLALGGVGLAQGKHGRLLPILGIALNSLPFAVGMCAIVVLLSLS